MNNPEMVLAMLMQAATPIAVKLMELDEDPASEERLAINVEKAFLAVLNAYGPINKHWDEGEEAPKEPPSSVGGPSRSRVPKPRRG